jgi:membrane protease YdiL (CAAX protease family)
MATMPPEAPSTTHSEPSNFIFYNDRGLRAGWRLLIFVAMLALLAFFTQEIVRRLGPGAGPRMPTGYLVPVIFSFSELIPFLVVLFLCWIMSRIEGRKVGAYGLPLRRTAFSRFWTGYVFWGFLPLSILLLIMRGLSVFYFGNLALHGGQILIWAVLWGLMFLMVGLFEEFLFRGYALHTLAEGIGFWPAAIIITAVFARAHMGNSGETHVGVIATGFFALFAAATLWRTGNLWLAVGAHAGWDWGQTFFYGVNDSGLHAPGHLFNSHPAGPDWLSGGSVGPEGSALTLILWGLMMVVFLLLYRKKHEAAPGVPSEPPATPFAQNM